MKMGKSQILKIWSWNVEISRNDPYKVCFEQIW